MSDLYVFEGSGPIDATMTGGGITRPGEVREFTDGSLPSFGPWRQLTDDEASDYDGPVTRMHDSPGEQAADPARPRLTGPDLPEESQAAPSPLEDETAARHGEEPATPKDGSGAGSSPVTAPGGDPAPKPPAATPESTDKTAGRGTSSETPADRSTTTASAAPAGSKDNGSK